MKKFFMLIICVAFVNLFGACGAEKSIKNEESGMKNFILSESVELNSGYKMPRLGLGTWTLTTTRQKTAFISR